MGRRFVSSSITAAAAGCLLVLSPAPARAQVEQAGVSTQIDPCVPIERERFHRQLAIELGDAIDYLADDSETRSQVIVSLTCVSGGIQLRLEDAVTRKSMIRIVDLALVEPQSRTRLMALTVAEFLVASWLELRLPKQTVVPPVGPAPPPAVTRAASRALTERLPPSPRLWQLEAAADVMMFGSEFQLIPSLTLRVLHQLSSSFVLGVGAQLGRGELSGTLSSQAVVVRLTTTSLLACVLYTQQLGDFDASAGLGGRAGVAYFTAITEANDPTLAPSSAYVPWLGPAAILGLRYRATAQFRIAAHLEAGFLAVRPIAQARDATVTQLQGGWFGASLGLGWAF